MERGTQRDLCLLVQPPNGWCWACPGARNFFQVSHMGAVVQILGLSLLLFQATRRELDQKFTSWDLNRCPPGMLMHCRHELCLLRRSARPPVLLTWKAKSKRVAIHWFAPQMPSTGRVRRGWRQEPENSILVCLVRDRGRVLGPVFCCSPGLLAGSRDLSKGWFGMVTLHSVA